MSLAASSEVIWSSRRCCSRRAASWSARIALVSAEGKRTRCELHELWMQCTLALMLGVRPQEPEHILRIVEQRTFQTQTKYPAFLEEFKNSYSTLALDKTVGWKRLLTFIRYLLSLLDGLERDVGASFDKPADNELTLKGKGLELVAALASGKKCRHSGCNGQVDKTLHCDKCGNSQVENARLNQWCYKDKAFYNGTSDKPCDKQECPFQHKAKLQKQEDKKAAQALGDKAPLLALTDAPANPAAASGGQGGEGGGKGGGNKGGATPAAGDGGKSKGKGGKKGKNKHPAGVKTAEALIEHSLDILFVIDLNGEFAFASPSSLPLNSGSLTSMSVTRLSPSHVMPCQAQASSPDKPLAPSPKSSRTAASAA